MRIVRPTKEGDDVAAKREALLKPKVVGDFLRQYDGAPIPADSIAQNVLLEKGVPAERVASVLALIKTSAQDIGLLRDISGRVYVDLAGAGTTPAQDAGGSEPHEVAPRPPAAQPRAASLTAPPVGVTVGAGVHINIEIHIAADASSETIEEIFRNMRRYVLNDPDAGATEEQAGTIGDAAPADA
jgi:hypothetical protein